MDRWIQRLSSVIGMEAAVGLMNGAVIGALAAVAGYLVVGSVVFFLG